MAAASKALFAALALLAVASGPLALATSTPRCPNAVNWGIAFDESGSIGSSDFTAEKNFVKSIITSTFNNGLSKYFVVKFDNTVRNVVPFSTSQTLAGLTGAIDGASQNGGTTAIGLALQAITAGVPQPGTPCILVLITDGQNNVSPAPTSGSPSIADLAKQKCTVVTVGVGSGVDAAVLTTIASPNPTNSGQKLYFPAASFSATALAAVLESILTAVCPSTGPFCSLPALEKCDESTCNSLYGQFTGAGGKCRECVRHPGVTDKKLCCSCPVTSKTDTANCIDCVITAKSADKAACPCCQNYYPDSWSNGGSLMRCWDCIRAHNNVPPPPGMDSVAEGCLKFCRLTDPIAFPGMTIATQCLDCVAHTGVANFKTTTNNPNGNC